MKNVYKASFWQGTQRKSYLGDSPVDDVEFNRILIILNTMEDGPEFEISYERLNEIADDLIAGKTNINMDY